jgi:hypothetical protein
LRLFDLATARTGKITAEQGLQHQHKRIFASAVQLLFHDVGEDSVLLDERNWHLELVENARTAPVR